MANQKIYEEVGTLYKYNCERCKKTKKVYVLHNSKIFKLFALCKDCIERKNIKIKEE